MTEPNQLTMDDDTRYLLPSEIARLVYGKICHLHNTIWLYSYYQSLLYFLGYLKQNHCDEVAEKFLKTSPHLKECLEMRNKHRTFITKAHNLTLEEISNQCLKMNEMCEYLFGVITFSVDSVIHSRLVLVLEAVNERVNLPKKFHDPVEALRFIIDPSSLKDYSLVTDEPVSLAVW